MVEWASCIGTLCCVLIPFGVVLTVISGIRFYVEKVQRDRQFQAGMFLVVIALCFFTLLILDGPLYPPSIFYERSVRVAPYGWEEKNGLKVYIFEYKTCQWRNMCGPYLGKGTVYDTTIWLAEDRLERHSSEKHQNEIDFLFKDVPPEFDEYSPDGKYRVISHEYGRDTEIWHGDDNHLLQRLDARYIYQMPLIHLRFWEAVFWITIFGGAGFALIVLSTQKPAQMTER